VVYITGGASGLGESAARYLYSKGHKIAIADINEERMDILKKEFCVERFIAIKCDVRKEMDVKNSIEETVKIWGTIHVALASAGVVWPTALLTSKKTLDIKVFKNVIDINLYGTIYVAKYASI
jgi:NADP-dependent 3-hydroxy acid dehydrogenase YdfG